MRGCQFCGAARVAGKTHCGNCGEPYGTAPAPSPGQQQAVGAIGFTFQLIGVVAVLLLVLAFCALS